MKQLIFISTLFFFILSFSQSENHKKIYFHWGWNWSNYTTSDIHFEGDDHNFTVHKATAHDRPSPFTLNTYFNPKYLSIPQYNFKIGFHFNDHYDLALGLDHMKYVVTKHQISTISGSIDFGPFEGTYKNSPMELHPDFLLLEHTDGLNFLYPEINRNDKLPIFTGVNNDNISINSVIGLGAGILIPRSDVTLLNKQTHDEFHLAGYGISLKTGLNITFLKHFFFQTEFKGGFINLPDIRTTFNPNDKASQHFFFIQKNILFGGIIHLNKQTTALD